MMHTVYVGIQIKSPERLVIFIRLKKRNLPHHRFTVGVEEQHDLLLVQK